MEKGMPLREWSNKTLNPEGITTARVFLIIGFLLGSLLGSSLFGLTILLLSTV